MISNNLNTKIFDKFINKPLIDNKHYSQINAQVENDTFISSTKLQQEEKQLKKKNNIFAYIAAGIATIATGLYIINRIRRGKVSSKNIPQNITETVNKTADSVKKTIDYDYQKQMDDIISEFIEIIKPKDEISAKKVLPDIIHHSKKLGISPNEYGEYIRAIKPEDADFMGEEGIKLITNNAEIIRKKLNFDPDDELLPVFKILTKENKDVFKSVLENTEKLGIHHLKTFAILTKSINPKHKDFVFNDLIPALLKDSERLKIDHGIDMKGYLRNINPENKDFVFDSLIPTLLKEPGKFKIKSAEDISNYCKSITQENKDFAFNSVLPLLNKHSDKLNIKNTSEIAPILGHITPETIDVIETVTKNTDKLKIDYIEDFILAITPNNKGCIEIVADNAEKLGVRDFMDVDDHKELLDKGLNSILKTLQD